MFTLVSGLILVFAAIMLSITSYFWPWASEPSYDEYMDTLQAQMPKRIPEQRGPFYPPF